MEENFRREDMPRKLPCISVNKLSGYIAILFLFFTFPSPSHSEELSLENFFKISLDQLDFENPNKLLSGDFEPWDGSEGKRRGDYDDYKVSTYNDGEKKLIVAKENGKVILLLDFKTSSENRCQSFLNKAMHIYGKEVVHYTDTQLGFMDMIKIESGFDFDDHRISFKCVELGSIKSANFSGFAGFELGSKEVISITIPRTMIKCKRHQMLINGKIHDDKSVDKADFFYIDHDDQKLLYRNGWYHKGIVVQFSDDLIKLDVSDEEKKVSGYFEIDRLTGLYKKELVLASEKNIATYGKPIEAKIEGSCQKVEEAKKF